MDIVNQTQWRCGALRRPRRVQRRNRNCDPHVVEHSFSPLNAGWDGAARHPYQMGAVVQMRRCANYSIRYLTYTHVLLLENQRRVICRQAFVAN